MTSFDAALAVARPVTAYRPRILAQLAPWLASLGPLPEVLDFGAGDGWFAHHVGGLPGIGRITPVDVVERPCSLVRPRLYDGTRLPFPDQSFDLAYAVDVLHHCPDPLAALDEMARVSRRFLLLKDHTQDGPVGRAVLTLLDELGNRRFGIPSPGLYQRGMAWVEHLEARGWKRRAFQAALPCHSGLLAWTNRHQFAGLWERQHSSR